MSKTKIFFIITVILFANGCSGNNSETKAIKSSIVSILPTPNADTTEEVDEEILNYDTTPDLLVFSDRLGDMPDMIYTIQNQIISGINKEIEAKCTGCELIKNNINIGSNGVVNNDDQIGINFKATNRYNYLSTIKVELGQSTYEFTSQTLQFNNTVLQQDISNCLLWFDINQENISVGNKVSSLINQCSSEIMATQENEEYAPTVQANVESSTREMHFDGDDFLKISENTNLNSLSSNTLFIVYSSDDFITNKVLFGKGYIYAYYQVFLTSLGSIGTTWGNYEENNYKVVGPPAPTDTSTNLSSGRISTIENNVITKLNGGYSGRVNQTSLEIVMKPHPSDKWAIGAMYSDGPVTSDHHKGTIAEILLFSKELSSKETERVEAYLIDKYKININN